MFVGLPVIRPKIATAAVVALVLGLVGIVAAPDALAATTLTVTTTADIAANAGDCGNSSTTVPSPLSLREATCIANNYGNSQAVTINIPAGHYTLSSGELSFAQVAGANVTLVGAGAASTIIDGNHASRVLDLDENLVGGVTASLSGITVTGGSDSTFGGAGIIAGSGTASTNDALTLTDVVVSGNSADVANPALNDEPGGGMQFIGGMLTITNSTFSDNTSNSSIGSGLLYQATGAAPGESLTITGSTFNGNSATNTAAPTTVDGGALATISAPGTGVTVTDTRFVNNAATGRSGNAAGAGIYAQGGSLTVTGSTFTGDSVTGGPDTPTGGAIYSEATTTTLHYNRFTGNAAVSGSAVAVPSGTADATENWWGCNTGPGQPGCDTITSGTVNAAPRLILTATASPSHVIGPNGTATLTAALTTDSAGNAVAATNLVPAFDGLPLSFSDPPGDATVTHTAGAHSVNLSSGTASIDYHSNTTVGPDNDLATLDNGTVTDILEVDEAPTIMSADTAHFTAGTAGSFTITTNGYPAAAITETGALPAGLSFHDNGDGSATVSGTPAANSGGDYSLSLTAQNGIAPNATQTLTVDVSQPPAFTSSGTATFVIGTPGSFTITTSGFPTVATISESGTLPAGITFTDNGDGTATLAGTPTGTGNTYPVVLTASNGVIPDATQALTIQVDQGPSVTLNPVDQTVPPGATVTFTAAASGVPTPSVQWQRSTDGGASFLDILGANGTSYTFTAAPGDNGNQYRAVFDNGIGSPATTSAATLHVGSAPAFTSADHTTFVVGSAGSFAIAATGIPNPTLSHTGAHFPAWLTLTDNGDGTGTLTGTPPTGSGGSYQFTLQAVNGFDPPASQAFTLLVYENPAITSGDHTTFTVGSAGSFGVTTTPGFPATTALTESGGLPSGVTFVDNGDGTAALAGTPAAGSAGTYPITISATNPAGHIDQAFTLTVVRSQTITVTSTPPSPARVGNTYVVTATSDSSLPVAYSIDPATTNSSCTISGSTVSFTAVGRCVIDFDQAGDGTFAPAARVQQSIVVAKVGTAVSVATSPASSVFGQAVHATATVTADSGMPAGSVQFSVDGTHVGPAVAVSSGTAVSPTLTGAGGAALAPGSHTVTATFTPSDGGTYASATGSVTQVVNRAATTTTLTVHAHHLRAVVSAVAPGAGTPTGTVRFSVGGHTVGTAALTGGVANLRYTVPAGRAHMLGAAYAGDPDFTASSVSTTRRDPKITARLSSARDRSRFGWYRTPVTVTFTCTTAGAPLTSPCPAPTVLRHEGAAQSVSRTISATDGGTATVVVRGIDIDLTRPSVSIAGVRDGATYPGSAPRARCVATDRLSGIAQCRLTKTVRGTHVVYRTTATDRAGNTETTSAVVTVLADYLSGARYRDGAFTVRVGHVYTFVVTGSSVRPVYYDAAVYPNRPSGRDHAFHAAGYHRWTLGVFMQRGLRSHPYWNIGALVGRTMHVIKIRIA